MQMPNDNGSKKPRAKKEGSKPLGRPKMRNPDGTLVHPPKMKKAEKVSTSGVLPTPSPPKQQQQKPKILPTKSSTTSLSVKSSAPGLGKNSPLQQTPPSLTVTKTTVNITKKSDSKSPEQNKPVDKLTDQKREEMLQEQLLQQLQDLQRRQQEAQKQKSQEHLTVSKKIFFKKVHFSKSTKIYNSNSPTFSIFRSRKRKSWSNRDYWQLNKTRKKLVNNNE